HLPHHRVFFCAPLAFVGAAGVKTAARRHIDRGRNFPHALHCLWFDGLVLLRNYRDRGQQHLCIGVQRISIECLGGGDFANLAQIHDRHPVGDVPHYAHVVGDEHIGEVLLLLQLDEHVDDLGLDGDIQRRGWLIQNDELGIAAQCPGYGDQLLLTAT
ncbi:LURP-one-related family protein, partial [Dysosmobacter welbionis]